MVAERCSIMVNGKVCPYPPSRIVSVQLEKEEYMIGLVCSKHILLMKHKAISLQKLGKITNGKINFQKIKPVMTDCVLNVKK